MNQKNLVKVPANVSEAMILDALHSGRLFIQPAPVPACDTRAEVLTIIARISDYATDPALTEATWQALLADDARLTRFRLRPKHHSSAWQNGSGASPVNYYRIAAIVRYMLECGFYSAFTEMQHGRAKRADRMSFSEMQKCRSAELPCSFKGLCSLLFPGEDYDLYRRNCGAYSYYEDECIIRKFVCHE